MKAEKYTFWFIFIFFGIVTPIHWFVTKEIAGTFALGATGLFGAFIAGYLTLQARTFDPRPEDREEAEVAEGAGTYGFFAPKSIWPFWAAVVTAGIFLGPALHQAWVTILFLGIGIWACSGWVLEFYRGDYKH
ncbi:MAG: cytochrome c oxidase subunit 4 [Propionibacteriaceae bacterium]|nr:cytochrome c oxidase subunit 4 [Propionibacteriaceae bacterium]